MKRLAFYATIAIFFGGLLAYPLLYVSHHAFWTDQGFTFSFFLSVFQDPKLLQCMLNSGLLTAAVTLCSLVVALPLAFATARLSFRGKLILTGLLLIPLIIPPFVGALGMRQFFARFGSINLLLMQMGILSEPIDWFGKFGFAGVVFLETAHLFPIMFLNLTSALANIDPALEEAALTQGASPARVFRTITFPLMLPGIFAGGLIVAIWSFTDLGTPLMMSFRDVIPVQVFERVSEATANPQGYALVLVVLLISAFGYFLGQRFLKGKDFAMVSKGNVASRERPVRGFAAVGLYILFLAVIGFSILPHLGVILNSVADRWFMTVLPEKYTTAFYEGILTHKLTLPSIANSIQYSILATSIDLFLGLWIAFMLVRQRVFGARVIDAIAMLPLAIPGIVLAFGYVGCFQFLDPWVNRGLSVLLAPFFGGRAQVPTFTLFDPKVNAAVLLVIAYSVRRLPYIIRSAYAGFQQVSEVFEEASSSLGATPFHTFRRITAPLIGANLIAGLILTFVFAMLEVSDSIILAFREQSFPITKSIYFMVLRADDGIFLASALGVWAMGLLAVSLLIASTTMGKRLGELFRA